MSQEVTKKIKGAHWSKWSNLLSATFYGRQRYAALTAKDIPATKRMTRFHWSKWTSLRMIRARGVRCGQ